MIAVRGPPGEKPANGSKFDRRKKIPFGMEPVPPRLHDLAFYLRREKRMFLIAKNRFAQRFLTFTRMFHNPPGRRRNKMSYSSTVPRAVEKLEDRIVLSSANAAAAASADVTANLSVEDIRAGEALVEITDIVVDEITTVTNEAGEITGLIANATVTGTILGQDFTETVEIPIDLSTSENPDDAECPILNLALGPVNLDLLGLQVNLDDCNGGPVTVDITAVEGGGLLGDLLCGISGALGSNVGGEDGVDLGEALEGLTDEQLTGLLDGLTQAVNAVLGDLVGSLGEAEVGQDDNGNGNGRSRTTDILDLEIENGLELNLLGLNIETSPICLNVSAERGDGNLLGNLLSQVVHLADRGNALDGLFRNLDNRLDRILDRL